VSSILSSLSESQQEIYDLLLKGKTPEQVARETGKELGIVNAQITRIKNKGIPVPGDGTTNTPVGSRTFAGGVKVNDGNPFEGSPLSVSGKDLQPELSTRPVPTGGSSNTQIANELSGQAISSDELAKLAAKVGGLVVKDVHPMILLGIAIQFVKLCGGRMTAHQVIEDVYSALRAFVTDGKPTSGDNFETKPLPQTDQDRIKFLEEQVEGLRSELQRARDRDQQRSY
jgi:hypothetical protein